MKYQHIRNATAIIDYAGTRFLIDPFLSSKGALPSVPSKFNQLKNPIVDLPLAISEIINDIDAVIVTHMHHFDHFDEVAKNTLPKMIPIFTQNEKEQEDMKELGFHNVQVFNDTGISFGPITIYRIDAEHGGEPAQRYYDASNTPSDASGVILQANGEETLYLAGDTLWNVSVEETIQKFQPKNIVLNAGRAEFAEDTPIIMGLEGIENSKLLLPSSNVIVVHLEAVNHTRVTRKAAREFVSKK